MAPLQKHPIEKRERLSNSKEVLKRQEEFRPILKPPRSQSFLETAFRSRGGLALSYRWFALGVGFGRSVLQQFRFDNVGMQSVSVSGLLPGGQCPRRVAAEYKIAKTSAYGYFA